MQLTVRLINDLKEDKYWFEEKLGNSQWVEIPETRAACEGNSRFALAQLIEKKRQAVMEVLRNTGDEETFTII